MLAYLGSVSLLLPLILQPPGQSRVGLGLECLLLLLGALAWEPLDAQGWEEEEW